MLKEVVLKASLLPTGRIHVKGPFGKHYSSLLALENRAFAKDLSFVTCSNTPINREVLEKAGAEFLFKVEQPSEKSEPISIGEFIFKTKPRESQLEYLSHFADFKYAANFSDMGLGKTKMFIDNAVYLYAKKKIKQVLVIAPNGVHRQWAEDEIPKHCAVSSQIHLWEGGRVRTEVFQETRELKWLCINAESISRKTSPVLDIIKQFLKAAPTMIVVDESQMFKSRDSTRTEMLLSIRPLAAYARIGSGTPWPNGLIDAFTQFKFLSPEILGMTTVTAFKARYCVYTLDMNGRDQLIGYRNRPDFEAKIAKYTYRKSKADCPDLPEKIYTQEYVYHSPDWAKRYREIVEGLLRPSDPLTLTNALAKLTKLRQLAGGFDDGVLISDSKLLKVQEICTDYKDRIIIWSSFTAEILELQRRLKCHVIYGEIPERDRDGIVQEFLANPHGRLVMNPQAAGRGLNIDGPELVLYYSNSFDLEKRLQSEDRNHRLTSTKAVVYKDLIVPGTIEVRLRRALMNKEQLSTSTLEAIRELFLNDIR